MSLTCQFTREYKQKNVGKAFFFKNNNLSLGDWLQENVFPGWLQKPINICWITTDSQPR